MRLTQLAHVMPTTGRLSSDWPLDVSAVIVSGYYRGVCGSISSLADRTGAVSVNAAGPAQAPGGMAAAILRNQRRPGTRIAHP